MPAYTVGYVGLMRVERGGTGAKLTAFARGCRQNMQEVGQMYKDSGLGATLAEVATLQQSLAGKEAVAGTPKGEACQCMAEASR